MSKFHYKFETIKKVKQIVEKKVQKEIAVIELEIDKKKINIDALILEKQNTLDEYKKKTSLKISEIQFVNNFEKYIENKIEEIKDEIEKLELVKKQKTEELTQKSKETKMFEKLEEKHFNEYNIDLNKSEQKEIDDIANKKFSRGE